MGPYNKSLLTISQWEDDLDYETDVYIQELLKEAKKIKDKDDLKT